MVNVLSFPFRVGLDNRIATVADDSDQQITEAVALLVSTTKGERHLAPTYGVTDPVASLLDAAEVNAALALFGPDVTITDVQVDGITATTETVTLTFEDDPTGGVTQA